MKCITCGRKVSARWSTKVNKGRYCPACYKKAGFFTFRFGSCKHLPFIEVVIDPLPQGQGPYDA